MDRRFFVKSGALALMTGGLTPTFLRRGVFGADLLNGAATLGNARGKVLMYRWTPAAGQKSQGGKKGAKDQAAGNGIGEG